ncbi:MAG: dephospho-CoA kinase [Actinomycetota bacterium]
MLAERGAVIVDADDLARRAVEPGTPGLAKVAETFGAELLRTDGSLDREALAARVFADPEARKTLESITHPEVFRLYHEELDRYRDTDRILIFDAPLIVETGAHEGFDVLIVVSASEDEQVRRLVADRGMSEADARARIRAQLPLEEKERVATHVIRNDGGIEDLEPQVQELWRDLTATR